MIGYRAWYPRFRHTPGLYPLTQNIAWPARSPIQAVCSFQIGVSPEHLHPAPFEGCSCGIWTRNTLDDLKGFLSYNSPAETLPYVLGAVKVWGKIIAHEDGFRAEYAQIVGLIGVALYKRPGIQGDPYVSAYFPESDWAPEMLWTDSDPKQDVPIWKPDTGINIKNLAEQYDVPTFQKSSDLIEFASQEER
jgi:hypothetical protein